MTLYVGLTGGIATGKSVASNYFSKQGIPVVDTDKIAHQLMEPGKRNYQGIVDYFGKSILNQDLTINRSILGQIVFNEPEQLAALNAITHPWIKHEAMQKMVIFHQLGHKLCVVDVPLLFESGWDEDVDRTIVIAAKQDLEVKRLMERNNLDRQAALERIQSQMPLAEKIKRADYTIENNGTIAELEHQLAHLLKMLRKVDTDGMS